MQKVFPYSKEFIEDLTKRYPTPFHIYSEEGIHGSVKKLQNAFSWTPGFKEYFAVKANPNPWLLKITKEEGCGLDCSSMTELRLAEMVGVTGENIMFSSNETPASEYKQAKELGAIINFDDITHIPYFLKNVGDLPELVSFRFNPGDLKKGNDIIGSPLEAKYGFTREQLLEGYKILIEKGVKRFAIHTMVASNELDPDYFIETAEILFNVTKEISKELNIKFELINLGGGIGIPYHPDQKEVDLEYVSSGIKNAYEASFSNENYKPNVVMEMGRIITGPYGWLVTRAIHKKETYKNYIGTDASMANLMRPAIYGAYHHITALGKENEPLDHVYDIVGSLCENNDKFAIDRKLPKIEIGDLLVIHDTGAHGHTIGFNYNGKLRSAELLVKKDGSVQQIRRPETFEDLMATVDFD